jgi:SAM-dependent methyltransferase
MSLDSQSAEKKSHPRWTTLLLTRFFLKMRFEMHQKSQSGIKQSCHLCENSLRECLTQVRDPDSEESFSIFQCVNCKLEQTWPQPIDLSLYYASEYYGGRHGFTAQYCAKRRVNWIKQFTLPRKAKLLDVGCGEGTFLLRAAKEGFDVAGVETNPSQALALGLDVRQHLSEMRTLAPFDCITLWHSLEHMRNPKEILADIRSLLAPNGILFIAVPNANGWQARLFGGKWLHRDVPRHLYHFNPETLRHLIHLNGFELIQEWHQEFEFDLMGWSQSTLNFLFLSPNVFFKLLTRRQTKTHFLSKILHWLLGILISGLALPLVPLSAFAGAGGTLIIAARHAAPATTQ